MNEYLEILRRNRNYRYLWLGSVVSQLGDWFNLLASAELITDVTNSNVALSYLFLARFLPLFLVSPLAGVLADRYNRKRLMIFSDVLRAVVVLGFLLVRSESGVWLLYGLTVLQFCLSALFTPARSAVLASIVPRKDLVTANALDSFTWSTMLAIGALLGGLATAVFGRDTAFVLDALTFVLSAGFLYMIAMPQRPLTAVAQSGGWLDFVDGFRYLYSAPFILMISLIKGAGSLVWGGINVLEISFANNVFPLANDSLISALRIEDGGTATLGLIYFVSGLGTGLGPLVARKIWGDQPQRILWGITTAFFVMTIGILSLGLAPTLPTFLVGTAARTVGTGVLWVFSAVLLQMLVPDKFRGRVFAFEFAMLTLTQSISTLAAGYMQDSLGWTIRQSTLAMAALGVVVALLWLWPFWQGLKYVRNGRIQATDSHIEPI